MNGKLWSKDPEATNTPVSKTTEVDKIMFKEKKKSMSNNKVKRAILDYTGFLEIVPHGGH